MIEKLVTAVTGGSDRRTATVRIVECDRCGSKVDHPDDSCPYCEDSRIVVYDI